MNILRPQFLDEVIGQAVIKQCIRHSIQASQLSNRPYPSTLLISGTGCGKTTLAYVIANELNVEIIDGHGSHLSSLKNILPYFGRINLKERQIFFIDEIHRTGKLVQELLYTAMEDFYIDPGKGRPKLQLKPFTLIGATTEEGMLLKPLLNRFLQKYILCFYSKKELCKIIAISAKKFNLSLTHDAIINLSKRSRGIPRVANNYLLWIRDYAESSRCLHITPEVIDKAMSLVGIESDGIDVQDRLYINTLKQLGRPTGLSTLMASLDFSRETIEKTIEPFLIRSGKVQKTPKGRILT